MMSYVGASNKKWGVSNPGILKDFHKKVKGPFDNGEYKNVAVIQHMGTANGGHYVCFVRGSNERYHKCDDNNNPYKYDEWTVESNNTKRDHLYVYFYKKVS
jgi:ubiquitin C-terminal hydrolase